MDLAAAYSVVALPEVLATEILPTVITTLCDNCGARVFPNRACQRHSHDATCGRLRHDFAELPIAVFHYAKGKPGVCCGPCAAAVIAADPIALRRVREADAR
jgi:hypothetical protein